MYRVGDNPLSRYPENESLEEDKGHWAVARLKSRRDKSFAEELAQKGISYYLPLYESRTRRRDNGKIRKSVNPLFPGYMAFSTRKGDIKEVYRSAHIANVIEVKNQDTFTSELKQIQRLLSHNPTGIQTENLSVGDPVRIGTGPMSGIEGKVLEWGNTAKIAVGVHMFGQAVTLELEAGNLIKL